MDSVAAHNDVKAAYDSPGNRRRGTRRNNSDGVVLTASRKSRNNTGVHTVALHQKLAMTRSLNTINQAVVP